jgi:acylpyruvate hydrolase
MRLATYSPAPLLSARIGIAVSIAGRDWMVDAAPAYEAYLREVESDPAAPAIALARIPADMTQFIAGGQHSLRAVRDALGFAEKTLRDDDARAMWLRAGLAHDPAEIKWHPPVPRPGKIIMIGGNYGKHVGELQKAKDDLPTALLNDRPDFAPAFAKFPSTLVGHQSAIIYPRNSYQFDYETELCVVIGKRCKDVPPEDFADVVAGYTIANDVSMRDLQFPEMRRGSTMLGKNLDTAMPVGPYLVTRDEIPDPQKLRLRCWVNGEERQNDSTERMIYGVGAIIAHYSRLTLEPGDLIATGSPAGVGIFWDPPEHGLLRVGDVIEMEIEGLGRLRNHVLAEDESVASDPRRGPRQHHV